MMIVLLEVLVVVLGVAVIVSYMMIRQLQKELDFEKKQRQQPYLIFSFEGPEDIFSIKNVGVTPVGLIAIANINITLLLDYPKTVTLQFEQIPMLEPRTAVPLKYTILDNGYPLHGDARHSFLSHLKASSFEARIAYRDWQNVPCEVTVIKDQERFFAKKISGT